MLKFERSASQGRRPGHAQRRHRPDHPRPLPLALPRRRLRRTSCSTTSAPARTAPPSLTSSSTAITDAKILVADRNFGCGSSREHAVWALLDAGLRVVIAPSFGDIFFNNAMKNGLLPIVLPEARCQALRAALDRNPGAAMAVDLETQTVTGPIGVNDGGGSDHFEIDPFRKKLLLSGMDDITFTMTQQDRIAAFETRYQADQPWL